MDKANAYIEPSYLELHRKGELKKRGEKLWSKMSSCGLCPRNCLVNRLEDERGTCKAGKSLEIASCHSHYGEEAPLSGQYGSGTIFFTHCSLRCVFCINGDISIEGVGNTYSTNGLAQMMLQLQDKGCHNINVVTPTHYSPHIILALDLAAEKGLRLPLVYNTSGYEAIEVLKILDGIVDIYLTDLKYSNAEMPAKYSAGASDYSNVASDALLEMQRQVGVAQRNEHGIMTKGMMIRHLIMPGNISGSEDSLIWIADYLPKETYINLMSQYRPSHEAYKYPELNRQLNRKEYYDMVQLAMNLGLTALDVQG